VGWIHHIPWQLKPAIPGFFNLCNAALRWGSLSYVAASICDMLMTGSELVLSVIAARVIRKRQISPSRWAGVAVVTVGLLIIRAADVLDSDAEMKTMNEQDAAQLKKEHFIGAILIIGQSVTAVCQDMSEELFLHEADFPATLLLGMEGMFGLFFGFPLYLKYAPETLSETWATLQSSALKKNYVMGLVCLFTFTGIFNIMATGVTSSMTRNMWKNFRTIFVWTLGLIIYYAWGNAALGEAWVFPDSFYTLIGFLCMLSGIYIYYKNK
jgi:drug/metabolite transporter (DMT)-like permease